jgi:hypothetical protein
MRKIWRRTCSVTSLTLLTPRASKLFTTSDFSGLKPVSRASCFLPPESSTSSRASDLLQSLRPPPELAAASRASCPLHRGLRAVLLPGPSTSSRASNLLQTFRLPLDPSASSRPFGLLQTLRPPPDPSTASRASYCLRSLRPRLEPSNASNSLQRFRPPPALPARLQSFVLAASGAFDLLQSL